MIHAHTRTVQIARFLRAAAPAVHKRRGGRMARQQQPDVIRLEYFKAIRAAAVEPCIRALAGVHDELLRLLADERQKSGKDDSAQIAFARQDANDNEKRSHDLIERIRRRAAQEVSSRELAEVAEKFGKRTAAFSRQQLDRQVRQATGVPLSALERPTVDRIPAFTTTNVDLIKTVPDRYFDALKTAVSQAYEEGWGVDRLSDEIAFRGEVADSDARRIARDQIGKLNAQVNQDRQESLGVTSYTWRGALDARERDSHRSLEGQVFEWDSDGAPGADVDGGPAHPGEAICCRCFSEPNLQAIIDGVSED